MVHGKLKIGGNKLAEEGIQEINTFRKGIKNVKMLREKEKTQ